MKFFNISKRKQKGHKKEDPFAQKINTVKASTPLERAANLKVEHFNTRSYSFPKRGREREREREPVDNKNTQEEAGNAEERNPSGGDPIASFVRSAKTHSAIFKGFTLIRKLPL